MDPVFVQTQRRHLWNWHRHPAFADVKRSVGQRAADRMRNVMGSWLFVGCFLAAMATWALVNSVLSIGGQHGFDPYPYILLNLMLSTLAGLQGAILLIAAKREDEIASTVAQHTLAESIKSDTKLDAILATMGISVPDDAQTVPPE